MERIIFFIIAGGILWVTHLVLKFLKKRKHHLKLLKVRDAIENTYIVSLEPETLEQPDLGKMAVFAVFAKPSNMEAIEREYKSLLSESGNRFWNGETNESVKLKVLAFYFQDGENVCETFEEYGERVKFSIMADRSERHEALKQLDNEWYKRYHHNQNVIEWEIKKPTRKE